MTQQPAAASLSLFAPGFSVNNAPQGFRAAFFAGAAIVSGFIYLIRRGHSNGVRKRVVRCLDRIAPKTRYDASKGKNGHIINSDCKFFTFFNKINSLKKSNKKTVFLFPSSYNCRKGPVCLCEFSTMADKAIRILKCRHALCSDCLEVWAVHCTKAHLNPSRFGITRAGQVISWTPGPKCPLCCVQLDCVPREDLREAMIAAINQRGTALSTILAYQARSSYSGDDSVGSVDSDSGLWRTRGSVVDTL